MTVALVRNPESFAVAQERVHAAASAPASPDTALGRRQRAFTDVLGQARDRLGPAEGAEARAKAAAQDFVATALIQPILKSLRESTNAAPPFAPGPAEKQFRGMMDAQLSKQIAQASRFPLVDRLARDLLRRPSPPPPPAPAGGRPSAPPLPGLSA